MEQFNPTNVSKIKFRKIRNLKVRNIPLSEVKNASLSAANFQNWLLYQCSLIEIIHKILTAADILLKQKSDLYEFKILVKNLKI